MERANVRFASRCYRETSIRVHRHATLTKCRAVTRSNRRFAVATARKSALCARTGIWSARGVRERGVPRRERNILKQCWSMSQCWSTNGT
eukprot:4499750-Lingulodinium_polyedra.AAC.1